MSTLLQQTRFVLDELGVRPHKQFGQHFLIDATVVERMVAAARITSNDTILEIGPGLGALSDQLAEVAGQLYLVEVDTLLAQRLRARFAREEQVHVITGDFLALGVTTAFPSQPLHVVASLPYNVATPILFRLLEHRHQFPEVTVMIQKEVAERLTAQPGAKAYGVPSVLTQLYATVTTICTVGPRSFFPPPKVESQVIRLVFQDAPKVAVPDEQLFRRIVKVAFGQRRKTLRNTLKAAGYPDLEGIERRSGIDMQRRGETLSLLEFATLTGAISA